MITFFIKMFAIYIGSSVFRFYYRQNFIARAALTKIVSAYFSIQIIAHVFFENFYLQLSACAIPVVVFSVGFYFYLRRLEIRFRSEFPDILTGLILRMKMGSGFRKALSETASDVAKIYEPIFHFIYENVVFSPQQNDKKLTSETDFIVQIIIEFRKADLASHKSVEVLENFRRRLLILRNFRRRSGRIRGQIHLQAVVITLIYGLCLALVAHWFSFQHAEGLVLVSLTLFSIGLALIFYLGQDVKWKI